MADQRSEFRDLLRRRRAELGLSLAELEARSVDAETGTQARKPWLSKVELGKPIDTPKVEVLRALAAGLDLPERIVKAAAAKQFLGFDPSADSSAVWSADLTTRIIVARAEEMSEEDRAQLAEIAETFARRRAQRNASGQGKPGE
ncbi:XRE family transcriptional regulator [Streptomyces griseoincarnatus]